jgi:hypothetical protein
MIPTGVDPLACALGRAASRRDAVGFVAGGFLALVSATASARAKGRRQQKGVQSPPGQGQPKVTLCHQGHTIVVAEPAVAAHLAQGDTLGPCTDISGGWLNVALFLQNFRPAAVQVRLWKAIDTDETLIYALFTDWQTLPGNPAAGPPGALAFVEDLHGFVAELTTGHVIEVANPLLGFPHLAVREGQWGRRGWDGRGATLIDQGFAIGETANAPGFHVQRVDDTATHKQFVVNLV